MASRKRSISNDADIIALHKDLDEASCPICMDHPHNAVLLLCSSHDKGCRSYICDTSHRHSNCLDRFKKLKPDNTTAPTSTQHTSVTFSERNSTEVHAHHNLIDNDIIPSVERQQDVLETVVSDDSAVGRIEDTEEINVENLSESRKSLRCPLCRGTVRGWEVVEEARKYLNSKARSCSRESCSFIGNYRDLRGHARRVHPTARPSDIEPSRERAWRRLEHQREYGDIVSAIRSAMPGAIVLGDYFIENGDRVLGERGRGSNEVNGPWWTTFFLFQMIGSMDRDADRRGSRSRAFTRHRRPTGASSGRRRRFLWGENLLGLQDEDDDDDDDDEDENEDDRDVNILSDIGEDPSPNPRRRRRLTRSSRSDEDQS